MACPTVRETGMRKRRDCVEVEKLEWDQYWPRRHAIGLLLILKGS